PNEGSSLMTVADKDKQEAFEVAESFHDLGFKIYATEGTAKYFHTEGLRVATVDKIGRTATTVLSPITNGEVQFVINTLPSGKQTRSDGFRIRREAVEHGIISLTNLDTAEAIVNVIESTTFSANRMVDKGAL